MNSKIEETFGTKKKTRLPNSFLARTLVSEELGALNAVQSKSKNNLKIQESASPQNNDALDLPKLNKKIVREKSN